MARPQALTTTSGTTAPTLTDVVLTGTNIAAKTASGTLTDAVATNAGTVAASLDQAQKDLGTKINAIHAALTTIINALKLDNTLS